MLRTYKAIMNNDRVKWLEEKPQNLDRTKDIFIHVTILDRTLPTTQNRGKNLVDFFRESPLYNSGIDLERSKDFGREVSF